MLLLFALWHTADLFGQSYSFRHYQVENGLSNNAVICSLQDTAGFLWFGTKDGLNRFDGYNFKVFRNNPDDTGSLGSNFILTLYEDKAHVLWVGTDNGLYQYNALSESFRLLRATAGFTISEIITDKEGNPWFINGLTLYRYNQRTGLLTTFSPEIFFESTGICTTPAGDLYVSTSNGLLKKYNPENGVFTTYDLFAGSKKSASKWIEKIHYSGNGLILAGTSNAGVKVFDLKQQATKDVPLLAGGRTDLFVRNFLQTAPDEFWIGTESGIFIYNTTSGKVINLQKKYNDPYSLSDNAVYTFCRDREGGVWSGTYFGGINYYSRELTPFKKYLPKIGENSLSGNVVREIAKDATGNLWVGTEDAGLNKLEAGTGKFVHFAPTGARGSISYSNIHGLLLKEDELWIGTFEHGLDVMNINTGKVVRHYGQGETSALKSNFIYTIYGSSDGDILLGTTIGIYAYDKAKDAFAPLPNLPLYNWYTSIVKTAEGVIWTSTYGNGVHYLNSHTGESGNFRYNAKDKASIGSDRVNSIFEDRKKNLWFATENGLCKWNPKGRYFQRYHTANGFPSNFIMSILEDDKAQLWISTTKGLVCFNPATEKLQVFTIANGLLSDQFNFSSAYKDNKGRMYFGSARGLVSFHPNEFSQNTFTPPVYITGFQVNNRDMVVAKSGSPLKNAITFTDKITLKHHQSTFSIDFAALSYTAPEMLEYAYRLQGLSNEWTYLKKNRKVYFTDLKPGTYVFQVKATNSSGVWNKEEKSLVITILPPWWQSWWAYAVYALLLLLGVAIIVRNYHRRMQQKAGRQLELLEITKEKELYEAKMEFFTNIAHEIRTPLTLIKGPLEKIFRKAGGIAEIQSSLRIMDRNTSRLIELTNQLLDFRQAEINGFQLSFVRSNISEMLEDAYQSFAALAETKGVRCQLNLPAQPLYASIDVEAFNKIVYNLLSNAVKYADAFVAVTLLPPETSKDSFTLIVKNDGFLIPEALREKIFEPFYRMKETENQKGTGIGLALSRSLAQLHKGVLVLEAPEDNMNVFSLTLSINQESTVLVNAPSPEMPSHSSTNTML